MPEAAPASLRTTSLDQMWSFLDARYYHSRLSLADPRQQLDAHLTAARLGPVTLGNYRFGPELDICIPDIDSYQIIIPLAGRMRSKQDTHDPLVVTPHRAVLYQPGTTIYDRMGKGCRVLGIKVEPAALHAQLARMLDGPVSFAPQLESPIDLSRGAGLGWARLVRVLAADALQPQGLAPHALMRNRFVELMLAGLLLSAEHRYRDDLAAAPQTNASPRTVRRVREVIDAHPETPFTLADLAEIAGVGPRALQLAFQRHVGTSPMRYLREVRLARVHRDLRAPKATTVAAAAYAWGFGHLGRFSALYRERYGVHPSESLRAGS
jgi:AraC-like DNA-binding protein